MIRRNLVYRCLLVHAQTTNKLCWGPRIDLQHQFLFISLLARAADRFSYLSKGNRFQFMEDLSRGVIVYVKKDI